MLETYVIEYGPILVFVLGILETSFLTGLVVPSGTAAAAGAAISVDDPGAIPPFALALLAGGFIGDMIGWWIGRSGGEHLRESDGWVGKSLRRHERAARRFLGRHPIWSVTLARIVSFVRTLMPMSAGMSGISFRRFLAYEIPGLVAWVALYIGIGVLAGESWQAVSGAVGIGWLIVFTVAGVVLWVRARKGRLATPAEASE